MLGHRLRAARLARGLTQAQLAAMAGVGNTHISKLESGRSRKPSFVLLGVLAAALEVDAVWLLGHERDAAGRP
jgi:transcriptional regulator with XRE-family HTH domain